MSDKVSSQFPYGVRTPLGTASNLSKSADFNESNLGPVGHLQQLLVVLEIFSASRTDGDETYDFYVTSGDGRSEWDIVHFPQIASTGAKRYAAVIEHNPGGASSNRVTTAVPGVSSLESATMKVDTAGADQGVKTLTAGVVRHGWIGSHLGWYLDVGGTTPGPVVFSISVVAFPE